MSSKNGRTFEWKFWDDMANVIPDKKLRLWDALYEALKKYYGTLKERTE